VLLIKPWVMVSPKGEVACLSLISPLLPVTYDANNNRIIQKAYHDTSTSTHPDKITYHINKGYEVIHTTDNQSNEVIIHRHNIFVNGKVIATVSLTSVPLVVWVVSFLVLLNGVYSIILALFPVLCV
jgi:hypothetical protein